MAVALSDDDENSEEFVIEASDSPDGDSAAATDGGARPAEAEPALSRRLERHPMLAFARVWQHTLRPGEILLMPWGTFHAVRNLTATLSYHRFHLDRINLPAFYRSMVDCDAPGISHAEILWNASHGLMRVRTARAARRASHLDARARARAHCFLSCSCRGDEYQRINHLTGRTIDWTTARGNHTYAHSEPQTHEIERETPRGARHTRDPFPRRTRCFIPGVVSAPSSGD